MLPERLLAYATRDGVVTPAWLGPRDEPWVRGVVDGVDALVGEPASRADALWADRTLPALRADGVPWILAEGVRHVLRRSYTSAIVAAAKPAEVRQILFEEAARDDATRASAVQRTAEIVGIAEAEVLSSLFADRPSERRLVAPEAEIAPTVLVHAYNLALVQGLLLHARVVRARVREHVHAVARLAKLRGLLASWSTAPDGGAAVELSGPLAVFHHTTMYGRALAQFIPALVATPGWRLYAECVLGGVARVLRLDSRDPIARTHVLPRAHDSAVEKRFEREVRKLAGPWSIRREAAAIQAGRGLFFPDFTLTHDETGQSVLVEIVGFYTSDYLARKLRTFREAGRRDIVVCIDESLACGRGDIAAPEVVRYRKRIDVARVLVAAGRVIGLRR